MRKGTSNNKKLNINAFTLIEMIAVIVIVGIIALIAIPSVTEFINSVSESSYKTYEHSMEEAAKNRILECIESNDDTCAIPEEDQQNLIFLSELVDNGFIEVLKSPEEKTLCDVDQSYIEVTNLGKNNFKYTACLHCGDYTTDNESCTVFIDDGEPPVCLYDRIEGGSTEWTNQSRTVSIYCQDSGNGCAMNPFSKKFNNTTKYGEITIKDRGGQQTICGRDPRNRIPVFVDKTLPTCQLQISGTKVKMGYLPDNLSVDLARYEDMDSGILTYGIGTSIEEKLYNRETSYKPSGGITTVIGYVKDVAGNEGVCYTSVKMVAPAPKFNLRYGYVLHPKEKYKLSGLEKSGSIFRTTNITPTIKFNDMSKYTNIERIRITLNSPARVADSAFVILDNNQANKKTGLISEGAKIIDFIYPTPVTADKIDIQFGTKANVDFDVQKIEVIIADGDIPTNQPVTVYVFPLDIGVATVRYSFDNELNWQETNNITYSSNATGLVSTENMEGTRSAKTLFNIELIDLVPPVVTINRINYHSFEYTVSDAFSGLAGYQITYSETEPETWEKTNYKQDTIEVTERKTYYIWALDRAGNVSMKKISNHALTISVGAGTTLVIRENDAEGPIIPSGTLVLYGTRLYLDGNSLPGYYGLVLKNGARTVTNQTTTSVTGETRITSTAYICSRGTYSGEGQLYCTSCRDTTPGYDDSPPQSTTIDACYLTTTPGNYVSTEAEGQVTCAKDHFCVGGAVINYGSSTGGAIKGGIKACIDGENEVYQYSDTGATSNQMCYYLTNPRYYIDTPYGNELICPKDRYCPGNQRVYYGGTGGSLECPNGYPETDDVGTSNAELCYAILTDGKYVPEAHEPPTPCAIGFYCPKRADGQEGTGDKIYFGEVSYNKYSCPADYPTTNGTGKSKMDECAVHIPGGVYVIDTHANTAICPKNQYCEEGYILYLKTGGNKPCPEDYPTTDSTGADSKKACFTHTTVGTYVTNCGPLSPCAEGSYCLGGVKVYCGETAGNIKCPGVYNKTDGTGKTSNTECYVDTTPGKYINSNYDLDETTCPAGYYCPTAKVYYGHHNTYKSCATETTAYVNSNAGSDDKTDCYLTTENGQYIATANATTVSNCEEGYYCPSTTVHYGETGNKLSCTTDAGIYKSSPANSYKISDCYVSVAAGKYITNEGAIETCPANSYCTGGTFNYGQVGNIESCSSTGIYTRSEAGSKNAQACYTTFTAGYYIYASGDTRVMDSCREGYYCPGGTRNYPNGGGNVSCATETGIYTQSNAFSKTVDDCYLNTQNGTYIAHARDRFLTNCETGYFCPVTRINYGQTGTRASCFTDGGIFVNSDGNAQSISDCYVNVPPGKYVDNYGLIVNCPANYFCVGGKINYGHTGNVENCKAKSGAYEYSAAGSDSMDDCYITIPAGFYINENHRVATCPAGYYCPGGTFNSPETGGNISCAEATGIYTLSPSGSTSISNCYINTQPGTYIKNNNDTAATTCEANYYCPSTPVNYGSSGGRNSCLNNAGLYNLSPVGSGRIQDCYATIPAGKYITVSGVMASCYAGNFCEGGSYNFGSSGGIKSCATEAGAYSQSPAEATSVQQCYANVPQGRYIDDNHALSVCLAGYYCEGGTFEYMETGGLSSCAAATGVYTLSAQGAKYSGDCYLTTQNGTYIKNKYDRTTTACGDGYYCPSSNIKYGFNGKRESCPSGFSHSTTTAGSYNDCYYTTQVYATKSQQTCEKYLITKNEVRNQCVIVDYSTTTLTGQQAVSNSCEYLNNTNKNGGILSNCYLFGSSCTCTLTTPVYDWGEDIVREDVPQCTPDQSFTCSASTEGQYRKICREVNGYRFTDPSESTVLEGACQENVFECGAGKENQVKTECLNTDYRCINGGALDGDRCYYQR